MGNSPQKLDPAGVPANEIGPSTRITLGFIVVIINLIVTIGANVIIGPTVIGLGTKFEVLATKVDQVQKEVAEGKALEARVRSLENRVTKLEGK